MEEHGRKKFLAIFDPGRRPDEYYRIHISLSHIATRYATERKKPPRDDTSDTQGRRRALLGEGQGKRVDAAQTTGRE